MELSRTYFDTDLDQHDIDIPWLKSIPSTSVHKVIQSDEKPFACEICQKTFTTKSNLTRHKKRSVHMPKPNIYDSVITDQEIVPPPLTIERQQGYCRRRINQTQKERYICITCGKNYSTIFNIRQHMKFHTGIGLHYCRYCQKSFSHKYAWQVRFFLQTSFDYLTNSFVGHF